MNNDPNAFMPLSDPQARDHYAWRLLDSSNQMRDLLFAEALAREAMRYDKFVLRIRESEQMLAVTGKNKEEREAQVALATREEYKQAQHTESAFYKAVAELDAARFHYRTLHAIVRVLAHEEDQEFGDQ